ncbi:MAG: hypothetical protein V5A41_07545 [Haloarculaceae archaeon]
MSTSETAGPTLSRRQYRWFDRVTKLGGVALIAAGLEVGGNTTAGIVLAALGVACGLATVFITKS